MKLSLGPLASLLSLSAIAAIAACSDSENAAEPEPPPPDAALPATDAAVVEDANPDVDAAPRECSIHGFCPTALPPKEVLRGVWGDGLGIVWAVSESGHVLRWDGSAWSIHTSDLGPLYAIWGSGPNDIWIGGDEGLFHGTGSPVVFASVPTAAPSTVAIRSIWGESASDVWAAGTPTANPAFGVVLHQEPGDGGPTWNVHPVSARRAMFAHVWGSTKTGVWVAGARPQPPPDDFFEEIAVYRKAPGATDFEEVTLPLMPDEYPTFAKLTVFGGAAAAGSSIMWIFGRNVSDIPGIWKGTSTDDGATFDFEYLPNGKNTEPHVTAVWALSEDDAWAVGEYGKVRRWDGTTWSTAAIATTKLPVIDDFWAVWSSSPNDVWIVGDGIALRRDPTKVQP